MSTTGSRSRLLPCHAESDPDFGKKAAEQLDKRKKVIVYCGRGGTLKVGNGNARKYNKDDPERMFGIETRSLKACHELLEVLLHLIARRPRPSQFCALTASFCRQNTVQAEPGLGVLCEFM